MGMGKRNLVWVALTLAVAYSLFEFSDILFFFVPDDHQNTAVRITLITCSGYAMWRWLPNAWVWLRTKPTLGKMAVAGLILTSELAPMYHDSGLEDLTVSVFLSYLLGAILVAVAEELLSRGVIFGLCESGTVWRTFTVSSITFGGLHFMNLGNGADLGQVVFQVINAAAFGALAVGLMLYTGSIWVPIFLHTFHNLPLAQFDNSNLSHLAIPMTRIFSLLISSSFTVFVAALLVYYSTHEPVVIKRWLVKLQLID